MMTIKRNFSLFLVLMYLSALNAQAEWHITGDAVSDNSTVFVQSPNSAQEFFFTGKLTNQEFKITDGTDVYVANCGDNDPLEQLITLRKTDDADETGLRIRYVTHNEIFRITLTITRNSKQITAERLTPPKELYIHGGPFNRHDPNWMLEDAIEMERDADNPFIFYYRGEIRYNTFGDERGAIKFLLGRTWGDNYHPAGSTNVPLLQASKIRLGGADTKWEIPADGSGDGYYKITVNLLDETIRVQFGNTNINELNKNNAVSVFSDNGRICIRSADNEKLTVKIFNLEGRKIAQKKFVENIGIALPKGCYIVETVKQTNEIFLTKIIL
ncbi:MAG: T9SS type A sorting domain-containing protein [Candidatus Symbiothrix sp.]|jgi:hypothetical protein|nr:T9SS type A sorting domain-containing protein [Candidatus Symbiothrix sp.]